MEIDPAPLQNTEMKKAPQKPPRTALNRLRREKGFTLQKLGELVGVGASFLSMVEGGTRGVSIATARKLADELDADLDTLLPGLRIVPESDEDELVALAKQVPESMRDHAKKVLKTYIPDK